MPIVVFCGVGPLLLTEVTRNDDGSLKSGYVVNGAWRFEIRGNEFLCKDGARIVTRYPKTLIREIEVPAGMYRGWADYNKCITWAEETHAQETAALQHSDSEEWAETQDVQAGEKQ